MDEVAATVAKVLPEDGPSTENDAVPVPESPKPLAFTIEFDSPKAVDTQKHKNLLEKFQNRHRRGQSLSKLEETSPTASGATTKRHPHTGNLPRKSSFQSEGYFSSDEKCAGNEKAKNVRAASLKLKSEMTLPLKNLTTDKMTQSFPNSRSFNLPSIESPEIELKDVSSPDELELISPISPNCNNENEDKKPLTNVISSNSSNVGKNSKKVVRQYSSPECEHEQFIDGVEFDFDKSDTVSDAGTYTLDADNYTEEQKARMSIDKDFKLEQVSFMRKAEDYIRSLAPVKETTKTRLQKIQQHQQQQNAKQKQILNKIQSRKSLDANIKQQQQISQEKKLKEKREEQQSQQQHAVESDVNGTDEYKQKRLSLGNCNTNTNTSKSNSFESTKDEEIVSDVTPTAVVMLPPKHPVVPPLKTTANKRGVSNIDTALKQLSLSQNTTVTDEQPKQMNNGEGDLNDILNKTFTKIMFPSLKAKSGGGTMGGDSGGGGGPRESEMDQGCFTSVTSSGVFSRKPTAMKHTRKSSLVHSEIHVEAYTDDGRQHPSSEKNLQQQQDLDKMERVTNLPPAVGGYCGKMSPSKIPSPMQTLTRPRSRSSVTNSDMLSDSSLDFETESYLKPTQNYIQTLQTRLSIDSDSDCDNNIKLNNDTRNLLKQKLKHVRHNSFDDRNVRVSNKLEHFQTKNLQQHQNIDQTYGSVAVKNQFVHRIQNSPNDSPVKRSSSFSTKNQLDQAKAINILQQKELNLRNSPNIGAATRNTSIQRSSSTANIKPNVIVQRRPSVALDNHDNFTESSSDEDFESKPSQKNKKTDLTTTRYNRAFSLRRGRLDEPPTPAPPVPKCPNTPEMKRKFLPTAERGVSVDRKVKSADVQSRYLNINKSKSVQPSRAEAPKSAPVATRNPAPSKGQVFSRTDSGRFSMKSSKPPTTAQKPVRKDGQGKSKSTRSNSTLSSREVEFQNWKRRKSYDPMKAAAEGKKKAEQARKQNQTNNIMVQSYNETQQEYDSSPSHSSSVHRSQSFHGTAALDQLISSEEEEDLTLSADEGGFSPPTPSPCEMSPCRSNRPWRHVSNMYNAKDD